MAVKSNFLNMTLVLTLVCLVCSAVLGGAYVLTKEPIAAARVAKTNKAVAAVLPAFTETEQGTVAVGEDAPAEYVYYKAVDEEEDLVGYAIESPVTGFGGELRILVGITADGLIYNTDVLVNNETPGLGAKCAEAGSLFREQWKGLDPGKKILSVKKDGGDIDAITASTITSRAYTQAVLNAVAAFDVLKGMVDQDDDDEIDDDENEGGDNHE